MTISENKIRTPSAQAKMMPLFVKSRRTGTMNPDFALSFSFLTSLFHSPVHSPYRIPTGWYAFPFIEDLKKQNLVSIEISLL